MNPILKTVAVLLILLAAVLGIIAFQIARSPAPEIAAATPAPVVSVNEAPAKQQTYAVVIAAKALVAGSALTAEGLQTAHWPVLPANGFTDNQLLLGEVLRVDVPAGDPITRGMLAQGLAAHLNDGERAVSIAIDEVAGAVNRIEPGDMVDVFFTLAKDGEIANTQARLLLSRTRVLAYGAQSVDGPVSGAASADDNKRQNTPAALPRTAILAVPLARVNELLLATRSGKLQLALRAPNDIALPDTALFAPRDPVLKGRAGLKAEQQQQLQQPDNIAYAGESLSEVAASSSEAEGKASAKPAQSAGSRNQGRSIEVIRGSQSERVRY